MKYLETTCKICRRPCHPTIDTPTLEEAEVYQEAVDKFLPLVTCNRCYDIRDKRDRAGAAIWKACYTLTTVSPAKRTDTMRSTARTTLEAALPAYADAIAAQYGSSEVLFHRSAIDLMLEEPDKCSATLKAMRERTRAMAKEQREVA